MRSTAVAAPPPQAAPAGNQQYPPEMAMQSAYANPYGYGMDAYGYSMYSPYGGYPPPMGGSPEQMGSYSEGDPYARGMYSYR